ncbi:hypothetical protein [Enterococcus sp. DIV0170]|uniref:hypothetical protein n=1 Tax=Enterococcus sp. DIV0170 TaxID=2774642 RepID=UPI003F24130B
MIYQQMTQLLNEIHRLMEAYDSWKDQLFTLDEGEKLDESKESSNNLNSEIENQKYLSGSSRNSTACFEELSCCYVD